MTNKAFDRTSLLLGQEGMEKLYKSTVAIFGIGGVGSFVAEGLARTGVGNMVLIDFDTIDSTNINRQIHANINTLEKYKVDIMKQRLLAINPRIKIITYREKINKETSDKLISPRYDYIVDAVDMVSAKLELVKKSKKLGIPIISAMGAGNKLNPTMFKVGDIYDTKICPLSKVIRRELRKLKINELKVVWSEEEPMKTPFKKDVIGSVAFVPPVVGFIIASEVVKDIIA